MLSGKVLIICLINLWINKKDMQNKLFSRTKQSQSRCKIKDILVLTNYAIKSDLKRTAGINTSEFTKKYLVSLKQDVAKLNIHKLITCFN